MSPVGREPIAESLLAIADQFAHPGQVTDIQPFGNGNINDTFLVTVDVPVNHQFILQRINTQVFRQPELVMQNMRVVTDHIHDRLQQQPPDLRWETPRVLPTRSDRDHWEDATGAVWRAISFIDQSQALEAIQNVEHAREVGYALGNFHRLISDLNPDKLADTLEGFHITPRYLQHYQSVLSNIHQTSQALVDENVQYCIDWIADRTTFASVLEEAKNQGKLRLRLMHGDPKVNNVMIDIATQKAVSIVDLDTVKPGLIHYDIGDCLRSGCNPLGEETQDWQAVRFDLDLCRGILQGYLSVAHAFLTGQDYDYLFDAIRLIPFELGLRFFTDHLEGDVYFKTKYSGHNLMRALVQFKLMESIEQQEVAIRQMMEEMH
ncbi:aminoglycoside phosphotransferase family protein [Alkalinema sp. FACHB-956]|uniref:phosphotransferase n=1 Tax=Alkalinema sp. FACHB-956 TaxID=2692768 RepID=UPI0016850F04|nr:aminoglycoside phosphotransferase family protein [Alkalinema sp. FACHB-956]